MSLIGSIQIAKNALFAAQVGLQVTGNNIANASTPGYIRQEVVLTPAPTQLIGQLPLGLGVQVDGIIQQTDRFLAERLRGAISDLSNSETQERSFLELEALIGELSDTDLSTSLTDFFATIQNVLNQPENISIRNFAALQGGTLTDDLRRMDQRVRDLLNNVNEEIASSADDINGYLKEIAELNVKIVIMEAGISDASQAVGLRDRRELALAGLSEIMGIRAVEQPDGSVSVFAGGDFLVFAGERRTVSVGLGPEDETARATINVADNDAPITASSGRLAGLYATRDEILGGFLDNLDTFSRALAFEFNKVYSSGQGLSGYGELTSESAVNDAAGALDQAGLQFTPVNGSFQFLLQNTRTGMKETTDILVDLNGLDDDMSLNDLAEAINAVEGVSAEVTSERKLSITSESPVMEFGFANDTSGVLAALGMNVFFTGSSAATLSVSEIVREDPSKFAASRGGIGADADNAVILAEFATQELESQNGMSLVGVYDRMLAETTQASSVTQAVAEGFRMFQRTLEGQQLGISGVSIDDEAINMITYQRAYQASARMIATLNELLNVLVNL
ncbi:MAG: flagellar hook-associated protein FlgK [Pirellulaceae bacterium]